MNNTNQSLDSLEGNPIMEDRLRLLPPEIIFHILSFLPLEALLTFGETSRTNNQYHILSLRRLRLGVFEKRVHSMISLLQAGWATPDHFSGTWGKTQNGTNYTISLIHPNKTPRPDYTLKLSLRKSNFAKDCSTPSNHGRTQEQMIGLQNRILTQVLKKYGPTLINLEFMAYDLDFEGAQSLATTCQNSLRHLALRFEHPHIRDGPMRPSIWLHPAPGSGVWSLLAGNEPCRHIGLSSLETLVLERAGITCWQLIMLVKNNPNLTVLKLRTCRGARPEFLQWLGGIDSDTDEHRMLKTVIPGAKLEVLWLEHCRRLIRKPIVNHQDLPDESCDYGFEWVRGLKNLQSLSFSESANIPPEVIDRANKVIWGIPEVILPYSLENGNSSIEVDPMWM